MRLRFALGLAALLAVATACASARNYPDQNRPRFAGNHSLGGRVDSALRIVTFNIQFARHVDQAIAALEQVEELRAPDVLALQEMDEEGVEQVARALSLNYVYYPSAVHPASGRNFGNAVLSPWRIVDSRKVVLPHQSRTNGLTRAAVVATLEVGAKRVRVYSIHFETVLGLDDAERRDQVAALIADAAASPDPTVIAGDFNSYSLAEMVNEAGFEWPTARLERTVLVFSWDHILVRGFNLQVPPVAGVVRDHNEASDHCPVWVDLGIPAPSTS